MVACKQAPTGRLALRLRGFARLLRVNFRVTGAAAGREGRYHQHEKNNYARFHGAA